MKEIISNDRNILNWITPIGVWLGSSLFILFIAFQAWYLAIIYDPCGFTDSFCRYDGIHYGDIASEGYTYNPKGKSDTAFFPGYPLVCRAMIAVTGWRTSIALVVVSHFFLLIALCQMYLYAIKRAETDYGLLSISRTLLPFTAFQYADAVLLVMAVWPTTFFWHMGYSESLFLAIAILSFRAMQQRWCLLYVAFLVGLATAIRPVGVALIPPFLWYCATLSSTWRKSIFTSLTLLPVACWGLLAYIFYLWYSFNDPFIFATTQEFWRVQPNEGSSDKIMALLSWEPIWAVYHPDMVGYWNNYGPPTPAIINWQFANPIFFLLAVILVGLGAYKRWLNTPEILLSAGLILIPYLTRGYEMCMSSQGRFTSVVFPMYLVLGRIYCKLPQPIAVMLLVLSAALMSAYAVTFLCGYFVI